MELFKSNVQPICVEEWRELYSNAICCSERSKYQLDAVGDNSYAKSICIIYPKGQRPNLPYPKNEKK